MKVKKYKLIFIEELEDTASNKTFQLSEPLSCTYVKYADLEGSSDSDNFDKANILNFLTDKIKTQL